MAERTSITRRDFLIGLAEASVASIVGGSPLAEHSVRSNGSNDTVVHRLINSFRPTCSHGGRDAEALKTIPWCLCSRQRRGSPAA